METQEKPPLKEIAIRAGDLYRELPKDPREARSKAMTQAWQEYRENAEAVPVPGGVPNPQEPFFYSLMWNPPASVSAGMSIATGFAVYGLRDVVSAMVGGGWESLAVSLPIVAMVGAALPKEFRSWVAAGALAGFAAYEAISYMRRNAALLPAPDAPPLVSAGAETDRQPAALSGYSVPDAVPDAKDENGYQFAVFPEKILFRMKGFSTSFPVSDWRAWKEIDSLLRNAIEEVRTVEVVLLPGATHAAARWFEAAEKRFLNTGGDPFEWKEM